MQTQTRSRSRASRPRAFDALKRRVAQLGWLDACEVIWLREGLFLADVRAVRETKDIVHWLRTTGTVPKRTFEAATELASPLRPLSAQLLASAHHDLRVLDHPVALDLARENRRALARHGVIDRAWIDARRTRLDEMTQLAEANIAAASRPEARWFDGIVEIVRATRGREEAARVAAAAAGIQALPRERREEARRRVDAICEALEAGVLAPEPEITRALERLEAARTFPVRARRRRVLEVLRGVTAFSDAPASLISTQEDFVAMVRETGHAMASSLPIVRDPAVQQRSLLLLAHLGLRLSIGEDRMPPLSDEDTRARLEKLPSLFELAAPGITLPQVLALAAVPMKQTTRRVVARWVAEGLDVELVALAAKHGHGDELAQLGDMRSARAYATWVSRLADHYEARGIRFTLSPELFAHLPKDEDLGVLAMCLMEQISPSPASASAPPKGDPIAILDATLALFQRLPDKAKHVLDVLRSAKAGEGRRLYPALTAWLGDDGSALVDRCVHLARLAREEPALSAAIREDFEHADRAKREREYLEKLSERSAPQQGRLDAIRRSTVAVHASPRGRTLRRLQERIDRLLPIAYRNELDECFREILEEAWGIAVPSLTPAWRDAVRFLLTADGNRKLLLELLRKTARAPGRDVKLTFEKNAAWIARAKDHLDVGAWLAPRRREFSAGDQRFVLELEEDPLEVLRMGIPFGTCLALGNGCNASSTVMNAIDANKRVLYVRLASSSSSKTRGAVVARKLIALSKSHQIIGYNLYVSVAGPAEIAIREHVLAECRALASAARTTLAPTGEPEQIHAGFWYDDGTVPFDEDVDVAAYCRSLSLPPPPTWFEDLGREAHGFRACETNDLEAAISVLSVWERGPANRALGEWVVDRLGVRGAAARAANDGSVFVALADALATGRMEPETSSPSRPSQDLHARARSAEHGMLRVLDLAPRLPESASQHRLSSLLARFPPSPKLAAGICDMGVRAVKRFGRSNDHGLAHLTMNELPSMLSDVAGALDLLDAIEPVWSHVTKQHPRCEACAKSAVAEATGVTLRLFERAPDPDVVVATLMNRHRSATAQCVALHIAARHVLPDGDRALVRLRALRPRLASSPDGIAAVLRQTAFAAGDPCVTSDLARRHLPKPSQVGPTFESLRDLVRMDGLEHLFGADRLLACAARVDEWNPGPWELAWRRRRGKDEPDRVALHEALFAHAALRPYRATRALELLALLGDVERVDAHGRLEDDRPKRSKKAAPKDEPKLATRHENLASCRHTAVSIAAQVAADRAIASKAAPRAPAFVASATPHSDALYIDRARRVLLADSSTSAERDAARSVVLGCTLTDVVDWRRVLGRAVLGGDIVTARRVFESGKLAQTSLSPAEMVDVWHGASAHIDGDGEVIRGLLAKQIAGALGIGGASTSGDWAARIWAAEREALARGLSIRWGLHPDTPIEGLLEEVALSFADLDRDEEALDVVTLDQLRTVVSAIASRGSPPSVAAAYDHAHDALTTALFVRAIRRQPPERAGAIREAIKVRLSRADTPKNQARQAWLENTRASIPVTGGRAHDPPPGALEIGG